MIARLRSWLRSIPARIDGSRLELESERLHGITTQDVWETNPTLERRRRAARDWLVATGLNIDQPVQRKRSDGAPVDYYAHEPVAPKPIPDDCDLSIG